MCQMWNRFLALKGGLRKARWWYGAQQGLTCESAPAPRLPSRPERQERPRQDEMQSVTYRVLLSDKVVGRDCSPSEEIGTVAATQGSCGSRQVPGRYVERQL